VLELGLEAEGSAKFGEGSHSCASTYRVHEYPHPISNMAFPIYTRVPRSAFAIRFSGLKFVNLSPSIIVTHRPSQIGRA